MSGFLQSLYGLIVHLGGFGLYLFGILDSSLLFMPLGQDLLVVAMTANRQAMLPYYAAMAALGSVTGSALIDAISRKGGEKGLESRLSPERLEYVKRKVEKKAGWAVAFASLMPPPFPFTAIVAAAAAFQYPRKRLLAIIGAARLARFAAVGLLAVFFGRSIIRMAETPVVQWFIIGLIVVGFAGSGISIHRLFRHSRKEAAPAAG